MPKRAFLMDRAHEMPANPPASRYDETEQLSFQTIGAERVPAALIQAAKTTSKTMQAPSDDDEDAESELCY